MNDLMIQNIVSMVENPQTLIIRYEKADMLSSIQDAINRQYRMPNAKSFIRPFIEVNTFVNLNRESTVMRGMNWLSLVYECMEGNSTLSAKDRFQDCMIITISHVGMVRLDNLMTALQGPIQIVKR